MAKSIRNNLWDLGIGILVAILLFLGGSEAFRVYRLATVQLVPVASYFEPVQLEIPDYKVGEDPIIFYDRIIHKEFSGNWIVELQLIQKDGSPIAICTATGEAIFQPEKKQPEGGTHLSWFTDKDCRLPAGTYRAVANWTIDREGASGIATTRLVSNFFKVTE